MAAAGGLIFGGSSLGGLEGGGYGQYGQARERCKMAKLRRRIRVWMILSLPMTMKRVYDIDVLHLPFFIAKWSDQNYVLSYMVLATIIMCFFFVLGFLN